MSTVPSPADDLVEGERRRDAALSLLHQRPSVLVRRIQRALLSYLIDHEPSTSDPVRLLVPLPPGTDPRLVGAAVRQLAVLRLISRAGLSRSVRREAHARDLPLWEIVDRDAALAWLSTHPELPEPDAGRQLTLWS
jgi:hypothetical protein